MSFDKGGDNKVTGSMKAAVYHGQNSLEVTTLALPQTPDGWAMIEVDYCGICGTDLNIYGGGHPRAKGPLVMGHEFAGKIASHPSLEQGTAVTVRPILSCGQCEACKSGYPHVCENLKLLGIDRDGAMAKYVVAPVEEIIPLPKGISTKVGALVEPLAVGIHAVRESNFKPGDQALVFGAGPIGLFTAVALRLLGAGNVIIVELQTFRQQKARNLGFEVIDPKQDDVKSTIKAIMNGSLPDLVFDCAAHPSVADILVDVTKIKGQIVLVGTYKKPTSLDLQSITFKEISIKGTRVYTQKDYAIALNLLNKDFDFEQLITHEIPLEEIENGFKLLIEGSAVKILVSI
jgi:(R,R)-butanediol dehydrogenase/meso-butanediol dehydrogenase/diacetyl reductase